MKIPQDLYADLLAVYEEGDRHTLGILAVAEKAYEAGRAEVEARIARYPLAQQVEEERRPRLDADQHATDAHRTMGEALMRVDELAAVNRALMAEIKRLDAKRV